MAEVTVIHSVVTRATGSTAMGKEEVDIARERRRDEDVLEVSKDGHPSQKRNRWFLSRKGLAQIPTAHRLSGKVDTVW